MHFYFHFKNNLFVDIMLQLTLVIPAKFYVSRTWCNAQDFCFRVENNLTLHVYTLKSQAIMVYLGIRKCFPFDTYLINMLAVCYSTLGIHVFNVYFFEIIYCHVLKNHLLIKFNCKLILITLIYLHNWWGLRVRMNIMCIND